MFCAGSRPKNRTITCNKELWLVSQPFPSINYEQTKEEAWWLCQNLRLCLKNVGKHIDIAKKQSDLANGITGNTKFNLCALITLRWFTLYKMKEKQSDIANITKSTKFNLCALKALRLFTILHDKSGIKAFSQKLCASGKQYSLIVNYVCHLLKKSIYQKRPRRIRPAYSSKMAVKNCKW